MKQRWHPLKRNYDLYREREQFAAIEGNFLAWEFVLRDDQGGAGLSFFPMHHAHTILILGESGMHAACACRRFHNKPKPMRSEVLPHLATSGREGVASAVLAPCTRLFHLGAPVSECKCT